MKTGVNTGTVIYTRRRIPKGRNCIKCKKYFKGFCKEFNIRITDRQDAKVCSKYPENLIKKYKK